ncbi:hypothetical protein Tco_0974505 [Tanacetum coccineum]|uniref:Retrotransposon gag domain-containing protein n=1 Tax=Tanacetum coccineum TaxID=301880 RepID=A0ABQ5EBR6_9ASTR
MGNNDLRTELEYVSEDYDEEREMEPRPEHVRAVNPPLRAASLRVHRRRERGVGFEETQNRGESRVKRNNEGGRPSEEESRGNESQNALSNNVGGNLPPNGGWYRAPPVWTVFGEASLRVGVSIIEFAKDAHEMSSDKTRRCVGGVYMHTHEVLFEDYPLLNELKKPSHIGSYDGKGDPDNFLHLFEGAIRMQKWLMPVACHMFTYTLKDSTRIWWNSQKAGSILDYEDLKAKYTDDTLQNFGLARRPTNIRFYSWFKDKKFGRTPLYRSPLTYKGLMEKTYTWVEAREVATNGVLSDQRDSFERPKKSSRDNNRGQKNKDRFSPYRGPNHGLLSNLSKIPREILATERAAKSFEPHPKMFGSKRSRDTSKYCHFHEDYGHATNDYRHLKVQIQEAINSGQLSHLVKGIKKEKAKSTDTPSRGRQERQK